MWHSNTDIMSHNNRQMFSKLKYLVSMLHVCYLFIGCFTGCVVSALLIFIILLLVIWRHFRDIGERINHLERISQGWTFMKVTVFNWTSDFILPSGASLSAAPEPSKLKLSSTISDSSCWSFSTSSPDPDDWPLHGLLISVSWRYKNSHDLRQMGICTLLLLNNFLIYHGYYLHFKRYR